MISKINVEVCVCCGRKQRAKAQYTYVCPKCIKQAMKEYQEIEDKFRKRYYHKKVRV